MLCTDVSTFGIHLIAWAPSEMSFPCANYPEQLVGSVVEAKTEILTRLNVA
jgi:hypothetical protein